MLLPVPRLHPPTICRLSYCSMMINELGSTFKTQLLVKYYFKKCSPETVSEDGTHRIEQLINAPTFSSLIPRQTRSINLLCVCISIHLLQGDIPFWELLVSYMMLFYKSSTITLHRDEHTRFSVVEKSLLWVWDEHWKRAISNPIWFSILLQIGHSLIKRWKNIKHMLLS